MVANNEAGTAVGPRFTWVPSRDERMPTYQLVFHCAACGERIAVTVRVDAFDPHAVAQLRCPRCHHGEVERTAPTFAVKSAHYRPELSSAPTSYASQDMHAQPRRAKKRRRTKRA